MKVDWSEDELNCLKIAIEKFGQNWILISSILMDQHYFKTPEMCSECYYKNFQYCLILNK